MSTWVVMIIKKVDIETYSKLWGHQSGRLLMFRLSQRTRWKHKQFLIKLQRKNPRRLFIFSFLGTIFSYICLVTYGHGWSTATILLLSRSVNYKMGSFIKLSLHHRPQTTPQSTQLYPLISSKFNRMCLKDIILNLQYVWNISLKVLIFLVLVADWHLPLASYTRLLISKCFLLSFF